MEAAEREKLLQRLKRIEGQARGLQRMVSEGQQCMDILAQIAAVRRALEQVGLAVLKNHWEQCAQEVFGGEKGTEARDELLEALNRFLK